VFELVFERGIVIALVHFFLFLFYIGRNADEWMDWCRLDGGLWCGIAGSRGGSPCWYVGLHALGDWGFAVLPWFITHPIGVYDLLHTERERALPSTGFTVHVPSNASPALHESDYLTYLLIQ
jgi:hypothetical protein